MWVKTIDDQLLNLADARSVDMKCGPSEKMWEVIAEFPNGKTVTLALVPTQERAQHLYNVLGSRLGAINLTQADREGSR